MSIHSEIFNSNYFQKQYRIALPPKELQQEIDFFWQFNGYSSLELEQSVGEQLFANLSSSLVFNLGSPFLYYEKNEAIIVDQSSLIAPRTLPIIFEHFAHNQLFGIKLHPAGLSRLLGINARLVDNQIIPLVDIKPQFRNLEQLLLGNSFEHACSSASQFLWENIQSSTLHKTTLVAQAIQLYQTNLEGQVTEISNRLFVSQKTLTRYFKETLGINPKTCFNIIRLRTALKNYVAQKVNFSIYDFGYTDYSHFVKEVKRYTHHIPSQLDFINSPKL